MPSYGSIDASKGGEESNPLLQQNCENNDSDDSPFILESTYLNPFASLTFKWIIPLLELGNKKDQLDPEDLEKIPLPPSCKTLNVIDIFEKNWNEELKRAEDATNATPTATGKKNTRKTNSPSLVWALTRSFVSDFISAGFLKLIHDVSVFVGPIVLNGLIEFLRRPSSSMQQGLILTASVTTSQIVMSFCLRHYFFRCYMTGLRLRTSIVIAVYKKALMLSSAERQRRTQGEIINMMTVDAQRVQDITTYGHAVWYSFLQISLAIYFLWQQMGPSCLGGVAVIIIMIPVNKFIGGWMARLQKELMTARDNRVDVNNEVLSNMKVIKLQAWEYSFKERIEGLRRIELKSLRDYILANCFTMMMWTAVPLCVALATFTAYTLSGHDLDVANALTALALFDILRFPLFMLPTIINSLIQASISFDRLKTFLVGDEYVPIGEGTIFSDAGIEIDHATFVYDSKKPKIQITNGKNKEESQYIQRLHDKNWEIKLLKAQLADAENRLMGLTKESTTKEMIVPLADEAKPQVAEKTNEIAEVEEESFENLLALRRVNFQCQRGELIAVVGGVGSGKTTFINSILGEIRALSGTIAVKGRLAYAPQMPFIMNDTVERNITFARQDESLDQNRYKLAIDSCALKHDLDILGDGDQTEIGEKGITLSGGQKARIGIARAVYHDADIYLLDDPLAAVDAHVGKHIFEKCIVDELLLNKSGTSVQSEKKSSVILITNAIQYLSDENVDKIIVLDDGCIAEVGSYKELSDDPDSLFSAFLSVLLDNGAQSVESEEEEDGDEHIEDEKGGGEDSSFLGSIVSKLSLVHSPSKEEGKADEKDQEVVISDSKPTSLTVKGSPTKGPPTKGPPTKGSRSSLKRSIQLSSSLKSSTSVEANKPPTSATPLMTNELVEREKGHVTFDVYLSWCKAAGGIVIGVLIVLGFALDQGISITSKWWLTYWSRNGNNSPDSSMYFLLIYALISLTAVVSMLCRLLLIMFSGLRASRILFEELLDVVLRAPMSFFDTTPTGRIINRFSKDVFTVDETLVSTLRSYLSTFSNVIGVIIVISFVTPYFTLCLFPMILFYMQQQKFFTKTYRELKRLDSVSRSPLYALLGETLEGVSTIRAYNAQSNLVSRITSMLDEQQNAYFLTCTAQCWLGVRLEMVGSLIICSACLLAVLEHRNMGGNETFAGLAGLSISFALSVTQSLNWSVRMSSDLEANMISVERIRQYCQIASEAPPYLPNDDTLRMAWPWDGKIVFSSAKLRYRPGLPLVLKGLDIEIPAMSKIGVVGRTGAGKSTLMVSLFRIVELCDGSITIDGIDISKIGLNLLRSKIAVIPQDPVLFSGSIRSNLDPFHEYEDERLYEVLVRVGLKSSLQPSESSNSLSKSSMQPSQSSNSLSSATSLGMTTSNAVKSLSDEVLEGGTNFSVGQRQLLVIARSLLRGSKIVIMDEATASVDADTDARIQRVMRTEFKDSTCITVAHRINTILDSDYILVMDDGQAAEFDKPDVLLKKGGLFKDLVDAWDKEHGA